MMPQPCTDIMAALRYACDESSLGCVLIPENFMPMVWKKFNYEKKYVLAGMGTCVVASIGLNQDEPKDLLETLSFLTHMPSPNPYKSPHPTSEILIAPKSSHPTSKILIGPCNLSGYWELWIPLGY